MLDTATFSSVASQMMSSSEVRVEGKTIKVERTSVQHLKTVRFSVNGHEYQAIEQNPDKPSQWGQLARIGHRVVQFKDVSTNRFLAVAVDSQVKVYGKAKV